MSRRGWVLFLAMSVIWGVPYLLIKVAVDEVPPVVVVFVRCAIGAALLLPWTLRSGGLAAALRQWRWLLVFTVLEMTAPWLLLSYAEQSLSSSLTGLLVAAVPFVAALAGRLAGEEERLTRVRMAGMGVGVVGIAVLLGLDLSGAQLLPVVAVALVVVGYATAPLVVSRRLPEVPGVAAAAVALAVTTVVYAPFALPQLGEAVDASGQALLSLAALGVLCTAVALALFFALIREVGPQRALVITFVNPAVAVLLGVLLLDEPFTLGIALGLPLVLAGCVLATRRNPPPRRPHPAPRRSTPRPADPSVPAATVAGVQRCAWAGSDPEYVAYHDEEWGTPLHGDDALFERVCLEAFQSGLAWITILRKRPAFRAAFAGFSIDAVAEFDADDEARLMADAGIVRNRAKIAASVRNARTAQQQPEGLSALLWSFAPTGPRTRPATLPTSPRRAPNRWRWRRN